MTTSNKNHVGEYYDHIIEDFVHTLHEGEVSGNAKDVESIVEKYYNNGHITQGEQDFIVEIAHQILEGTTMENVMVLLSGIDMCPEIGYVNGNGFHYRFGQLYANEFEDASEALQMFLYHRCKQNNLKTEW